MPKAYEAMRDKFAQTMPLKAAKTKAAKIYNSNNPGNPVTGRSEGKRKKKSSPHSLAGLQKSRRSSSY